MTTRKTENETEENIQTDLGVAQVRRMELYQDVSLHSVI